MLPGGHQLFHLPAEDQRLPGPTGQYQQSGLVNYLFVRPFLAAISCTVSSGSGILVNFLKCGATAGLPLQGQPSLYGLQLPAAVCADLLCLPHHPQGENLSHLFVLCVSLFNLCLLTEI